MRWDGPETELWKMNKALSILLSLDLKFKGSYRGRIEEIGKETDLLMKFWKTDDFPRFKAQVINIERIYQELARPDAVLDAAPLNQEETHD